MGEGEDPASAPDRFQKLPGHIASNVRPVGSSQPLLSSGRAAPSPSDPSLLCPQILPQCISFFHDPLVKFSSNASRKCWPQVSFYLGTTLQQGPWLSPASSLDWSGELAVWLARAAT